MKFAFVPIVLVAALAAVAPSPAVAVPADFRQRADATLAAAWPADRPGRPGAAGGPRDPASPGRGTNARSRDTNGT